MSTCLAPKCLFFWAHLRVMNLWHAYLKQNECNVLYAGSHLQCENSRYTSSFLIILSPEEYTWVQWVCKDFQEETVCRLLATVKKRQWFCLSTTAIDSGPCVSKWMICVCVQPGVVPLLSSVVQWPHLQQNFASWQENFQFNVNLIQLNKKKI